MLHIGAMDFLIWINIKPFCIRSLDTPTFFYSHFGLCTFFSINNECICMFVCWYYFVMINFSWIGAFNLKFSSSIYNFFFSKKSHFSLIVSPIPLVSMIMWTLIEWNQWIDVGRYIALLIISQIHSDITIYVLCGNVSVCGLCACITYNKPTNMLISRNVID